MKTKETLEKINKSIQATNELLSVAEKYYKEDYTIFEYGVLRKPEEYQRELLYLESAKKALEYLGEETKIKLGKYLCAYVSFDWGRFCISLCLDDDETESKLYDSVFGSHSGVNEFVQKHIPELISPILGDTKYSYAFGCYDLSEIFGNQKFGKNEKDRYYFANEEFEKDVARLERKIDFLKRLSTNESLLVELDNWLGNYFNLIITHNED